jgi:YHS domain-containing protein
MWSFISRFIELLFIFYIVRSVISSVSRMFGGSSPAAHVPPVQQPPAELHSAGVFKKDPVCQTYIQVPSEWARRVGDDTIYFCSKECRDRFKV